MAETSMLPFFRRRRTSPRTGAKGSLGSETVALKCMDTNALKRAVEALPEHFRKV